MTRPRRKQRFSRNSAGTSAVSGSQDFDFGTDKPFLRFSTMAGPLLVYAIWQGPEGAEEPVRVMEVDGAFQSATYLADGREYEPVFAYIRAYDCLFEARDEDGAPAPAANLCALGGGGYAWPKHVIATRPDSRLDVVELDPAVTAVAERYFFLDRLMAEFDTEETGRLGLVTDDALHYLETYAGAPYDAIINDLFSGKHPVESLMTEEAARLIRARLVPGGLYLTNVIGALEGEDAAPLHRLAGTLGRAFVHVWVVPVGAWAEDDRDNNLLVASDKAWIIPGARELV